MSLTQVLWIVHVEERPRRIVAERIGYHDVHPQSVERRLHTTVAGIESFLTRHHAPDPPDSVNRVEMSSTLGNDDIPIIPLGGELSE